MPSDQSTWLLAIPQDGDADGAFQELHTKLGGSKNSANLSPLVIPSFKVHTYNIHAYNIAYIDPDATDRNVGISH